MANVNCLGMRGEGAPGGRVGRHGWEVVIVAKGGGYSSARAHLAADIYEVLVVGVSVRRGVEPADTRSGLTAGATPV